MVRRVLRDVQAYWAFALAFTALLVVGVGVVPSMLPHKPERFCTLGLAFTEVNGVGVALEDQGAPGRDRCDMDPERWMRVNQGEPMNVLFFDCKVRNPDMKVVATTTPNRSDGTCGAADR